MTRRLHLNLFITGCGHHKAAWRHPLSSVEQLGSIAYFEGLAQTAERGLFDAVFFADGQAVGPVADGPTGFLEPITALAAMSRATTRIGLVTTVSSTFYTPFHAARLLASLDHISDGRVGWNVVTSMWHAEARNHGLERMPTHAERYARAEEFVDVVLALWDSWADDALRYNRAGEFAHPAGVRALNHVGAHFRVDGPLNVPRPPQGNPVLFQAGASDPGRALAARRAEAVYAVAADLPSAQEYYRDLKLRIRRAGRQADAVPILPGLVTYVGSTEAEAASKQRELDALLPAADSLRQLGQFVGLDCSNWELDQPMPKLVPLAEFTGPQGRYATILQICETVPGRSGGRLSVRQLLGRLAAGGGHATMVGTPEQIADEMIRWLHQGGADGFNLMPPTLPGGIEDFVDHVVPVLQARGVFRREYAGRTLRSHLGLERPAGRPAGRPSVWADLAPAGAARG
ncbi:LLM class flavin-dependent oxidoreductase [Cryobacterium roopkundense]|uniref:FMN-dependent oxidoreductase (Nitrilotriacetate monooxygenase family) n=1 Tax=Cryobacterium roopkundense TaxID=1001240 RepID=A0A7W8ZYP5_9MICO|nr:LLM class flavin-dependent oxidoreductase [Cryobacterium roopkundense]MBB5642567.1 FMN-dependent oxidoreductase (nitrilotriacetate monooxygenase family) [Cryobacterium roopkundense]